MTGNHEEPLPQSAVYEALLKYSTDVVAIVGPDRKMRYASPSYLRTLGYAPGAIIGSGAFDRVHPDDLVRIREAFQQCVAEEGTPVTVEFRYRHGDGSWRFMEVTGTSHLSDPMVEGVILNARDITERVQAEHLLREKEAQYREIFESTSDGIVIGTVDGIIAEPNPAYCAMHGYTREELVGQHARMLVHPDYQATFAQFIREVIEKGTSRLRRLDIRKDGEAFPVEINGSVISYRSQPAVLAVVRDITERARAEELLEQRVRERTRELSALLDISSHVASTLELRPLLGLILDQLNTLIEHSGSMLVVSDGEALQMLEYRVPDGRSPIRTRTTLRESRLWTILQHRESLVIDDVLGDTPDAAMYREAMGSRLDATRSYVRSYMAVPMTLKDRVIGGLIVSHAEPGYFTERHRELAMAIAQQAAIAIENARLYEQAQEVAVLEERQRLSRELHDSVSQALYGIALGTKTAWALMDGEPEAMREPLQYVLSQAEIALAEMRALIFELRPESLQTEGLVAALERQSALMRARHGLTVNAQLNAEPEVSIACKEALYRIAQEALHNIVKHAGATALWICLSSLDDLIGLEIRDNGRGFNPEEGFPGHLGLRTMRERAEQLGGTVEISSVPGKGTKISVWLPTTGGR